MRPKYVMYIFNTDTRKKNRLNDLLLNEISCGAMALAENDEEYCLYTENTDFYGYEVDKSLRIFGGCLQPFLR